MAEAELGRLSEMLREHARQEIEVSEKFQALIRRHSIEDIQNRLQVIVKEHSNEKQTLERNVTTLTGAVQTAERDNQRLRNENASLQERLQEEQERRRLLEQDSRNTISGLEANIQTLERRSLTIETQLQEAANNQRQKAESDAERIRTLREETIATRREIEREQIERRQDCQKLQNDVSARERSIREAEQENARLRERLDRLEKEIDRKEQTVAQLREDTDILRTERTKLEIQIADAEQQYTERITEAERETLRQDQEILDLKERLDAVMNIIQIYIQKNARTSVEIGKLRERMGQVDREQTENREMLQQDLRRNNQRRLAQY